MSRIWSSLSGGQVLMRVTRTCMLQQKSVVPCPGHAAQQHTHSLWAFKSQLPTAALATSAKQHADRAAMIQTMLRGSDIHILDAMLLKASGQTRLSCMLMHLRTESRRLATGSRVTDTSGCLPVDVLQTGDVVLSTSKHLAGEGASASGVRDEGLWLQQHAAVRCRLEHPMHHLQTEPLLVWTASSQNDCALAHEVPAPVLKRQW